MWKLSSFFMRILENWKSEIEFYGTDKILLFFLKHYCCSDNLISSKVKAK